MKLPASGQTSEWMNEWIDKGDNNLFKKLLQTSILFASLHINIDVIENTK